MVIETNHIDASIYLFDEKVVKIVRPVWGMYNFKRTIVITVRLIKGEMINYILTAIFNL